MESSLHELRVCVWDNESLPRGHIAPFKFGTSQPDHPGHDAWHFSTDVKPGTWAYVCTRGARVIFTGVPDKTTQKSKSDAIPMERGTVVGLSNEGYQVRMDNCDPSASVPVHNKLRPEDVLPAACHLPFSLASRTYQMSLGPNNVEFRVGFRTDNSLSEARRQPLSFVKKSDEKSSWKMSNGLLLQHEVEKQVRKAQQGCLNILIQRVCLCHGSVFINQRRPKHSLNVLHPTTSRSCHCESHLILCLRCL